MADTEVSEISEKVEKMKVTEDSAMEFPDKKKKKKKKDTRIFEDLQVPSRSSLTASESSILQEGDVESIPLEGKKKKKRGKDRRFDFDLDETVEEKDAADVDQEQVITGKYPWSGTDRDYTYEELLDRVYRILHENNPELTGERKKISMKAPQVVREGTKKTVFWNFAELCKAINRNLDHVMQFVIFELGTTGSLDGQQRLVVRGRFNSKNFETVLRAYMVDYVLCDSCKSLDTLLDRDSATRLMHLRCQQCGASKTVQAVKSGFVARVGRRPR